MKTFLAITAVLAGSFGFVLAGCASEHAVSLGPPPRQASSSSGSDIGRSSSATGTRALPTSLSFEVWFARGERLVAEPRTHRATPRVATAALAALLAGPARDERTSGVTTAIPAGTRLLGISIKGGVATVNLTSEFQSGGGSLSMEARLGQVVYTLTQFPTVQKVRFELDGRPVNVFSSEGIVLDHPVGRSDYQDLSPPAAPVAGTWRRLPPAPVAPDFDRRTSVWTGTELLVFGRIHLSPHTLLRQRNVAAAYNPATGTWRRLAPPQARAGSVLTHSSAVWTGKEMLVSGPDDLAFDPRTNQWRRLPRSPAGGRQLVVWTGRELIGWGGGCCGDAFSDGVAYNPAANTWRKLPRSPLGGSQHPTGAWTGHELVIFVSGLDPDGKRWPGRLARAAAYNPATNTWRRIAPLPALREGATAVWDGREVLVVGGTGVAHGANPPAAARVGFAFDPKANRWRRLAPMSAGRTGALGVWTGRRLLLWGGQVAGSGSLGDPLQGLAYDPRSDRWSSLPRAPLPGRLEPTAVWTGRSLLVWGGVSTTADHWGKYLAAGAAFTPATP